MIRPVSQAEIALWRGLKKTLIVLLALARLQRPAGVAELAEMLDFSQKTVRGYLRSLAALGLAASVADGWATTPIGQQFMLLGAQAEIFKDLKDSNLIIIINDPLTLTKDQAIIITNQPEASCADALSAPQPTPNRPPSPPEPGALRADVLKAFQEAGICLNGRTRRLARQPWISAERIRMLRQALAERGKAGHTGLLITLLEQNAHSPPECDPGADRNRYITGKYADLIEH